MVKAEMFLLIAEKFLKADSGERAWRFFSNVRWVYTPHKPFMINGKESVLITDGESNQNDMAYYPPDIRIMSTDAIHPSKPLREGVACMVLVGIN